VHYLSRSLDQTAIRDKKHYDISVHCAVSLARGQHVFLDYKLD